jgi:hypothetical protein
MDWGAQGCLPFYKNCFSSANLVYEVPSGSVLSE